MTHRTSWPESTGESSGHLISIALQEEANAILVGPKQDSMLLYNALVKGAIKQKVWSLGGFTGSHLSVSTLSLCGPSSNLIRANMALADR